MLRFHMRLDVIVGIRSSSVVLDFAVKLAFSAFELMVFRLLAAEYRSCLLRVSLVKYNL